LVERFLLFFWTDTWKPDSYYEKLKENKQIGLHTLCLLDIKVKEQSMENLIRGRKIYEPPRFMTVNQAAAQLLEIEENRKEGVLTDTTICIGVARIGQPNQMIVTGTLKQLLDVDFGTPLHSLVICGDLHSLEEEFINQYRLNI